VRNIDFWPSLACHEKDSHVMKRSRPRSSGSGTSSGPRPPAWCALERVGPTRLARSDPSSPLYRPLTGLLLVAFGPAQVISAEPDGIAGINEAHVFGSWAARYSGEAGAAPDDADIVVVGDPRSERRLRSRFAQRRICLGARPRVLRRLPAIGAPASLDRSPPLPVAPAADLPRPAWGADRGRRAGRAAARGEPSRGQTGLSRFAANAEAGIRNV
jgi:hypothetical protein